MIALLVITFRQNERAREPFIRGVALAGAGRLPLETRRRGVFAVGEMRSGSVKRVAAAVGDGAQVVATLYT